MSLTFITDVNFRSQPRLQKGNLTVPQFSFLALLLTFGAVAADQFASPSLYSSSPLWAVLAGMILVWRRRRNGLGQEAPERSIGFSPVRMELFALAHVALIYAARNLQGGLEQGAGTSSPYGGMTTALKFSVLLPTLLLLPLARWRKLARLYSAEGLAALAVLFTFFPVRIVAFVWPWYGQILGRFVFAIARLLAPGLTYSSAFTPTLHGPDLDVTILLACSGINGIELFDYLFSVVVLLDWNRLHKGRTILAYFGGILAMLFGNALRIAALVVLGNRGFAGMVAGYHLSTGWIFFLAAFLLYLALIYRMILHVPESKTPNCDRSPLIT